MTQLLWSSIPVTSALCQKRKVGLQARKIGPSRALWPLLFPQAIPFCERNNDPILVIEKNKIVAVSWLATYPTNL
ncbi:hypothetical protein KSZ_04810 [Dictyobacter formicarum]|uniref:Uncharacterized protein n=1 Tax=Dictyobacter formicarum TaxID=2778368 RepID=A0ABQ3V8M0_9CHLR|nr:hypothetical protein KSZ_04810 [Dictyobacter formicarum]